MAEKEGNKIKSISEIIEEVSPYYKKKGEAESSHKIIYDSNSETLEPIYFYILDLLGDFGLAPEKLIDNFTSTPGSGHFAELGQRATIMQQQATKILGDTNTVLRSVLNVIYDLKEFKIRLEHYKGLHSKDEHIKDASRLSLKQVWMDKVDIAKQQSSIKAMALGQAGFQTLIDAFLAAKEEKDIDKLDLNDRVKRILKPRILEFNHWVTQSEKELQKRYEIEKNYLRSQVNSLKLYSRWAKPYLKAAQDLESQDRGREPALVKTFNTLLLELTLLGKRKVDVAKNAASGDLPKEFSGKAFQRSLKRDYYMCVLVDFKFRGIPQRAGGQQAHYLFGGKAEVTFTSYALNDDELKKMEKELGKSDIEDVLTLIEGTTTESLDQLQEEINFFLEEKDEEEKKKETKSESNPFLALIGKYNSKEGEKKQEPKEETTIKPDNFIEAEHLRSFAAKDAKETIFDLFDIYKKAHGMESYT
jgi:hypothetical protein